MDGETVDPGKLRQLLAAQHQLLDKVTDSVVDLTTRVEGLEATAAPVDPGRYPQARDRYTMYDLQAWVTEWLGRTLERSVGGSTRWCTRWYAHPEAVTRLWIVFHSYRDTVALDDAIGQAQWYLTVLEPHIDALLGQRGPFARCTPERHAAPSHLPVVPNRDAERDWGPAPRPPGFPPLRS